MIVEANGKGLEETLGLDEEKTLNMTLFYIVKGDLPTRLEKVRIIVTTLNLAVFSRNIEGILGFISQRRGVVAKCAALTAKRTAKGFMTIAAQYLLPAVAGNALGFLVEKEDAPVHVMGDNPFF